MSDFGISKPALPRRAFLGGAASAGLALAANTTPARTLPTIKLGNHEVTRLIAGYNPIGGYAHSVPKLSAIMRNWFTPERILEYVQRCEQEGINTWQASTDPRVYAALREAWDKGSKVKWICLTGDMDAVKWREIAALKPIAAVHHGEQTDRLYRSGDQSKISDFIKKVHDLGMLAGVSSHSPENIARSEDANWEHDLYMTCFYNIRRDEQKVRQGLGELTVDEMYLERDPERMTAVVQRVKRPCLGFKILAAGRLCNNRAAIQRAFAYAYSRIKPADAVIVGMFPILTDEIAEDAEIARAALSNR